MKDTTEMVKEIKEMDYREAVAEFWALGIGLDALVRASGTSTNSVSKYLNFKLFCGTAFLKIDRALCRILKIDKIIFSDVFDKDQGGE